MQKLDIGKPLTYKTLGFKSQKDLDKHLAIKLAQYHTERMWSENELTELIKTVFDLVALVNKE